MDVDKEESNNGREKTWNWKSKDKQARKRIIKKGNWDGVRPTEGSVCKIIIDNVEGDLASDIMIGKEFTFTIGCGDTQFEGLLERCLLNMDQQEEAYVELGSIKCTVKLISFTSPETPEYFYDIDEAIKAATEHKEKGVEHFKNNRVNEAYSRFKRAIRIIIFAGKTEEKVLPLYITVCNNIALCHLKLNHPELGIDVCNKVLEHDAKNVKALLRRSACYNMVRDFEKAHADLVKVLEIEPNNPTAKEMLPPIKADIVDMNKRYKNMVKKMFNYA